MAVQGRGMALHKRHPHIQPLLKEALQLSRHFQSFQIEHIRRQFNTHADSLSSLSPGAQFCAHGLPSMPPSLPAPAPIKSTAPCLLRLHNK
jgi:hypothetical protein